MKNIILSILALLAFVACKNASSEKIKLVSNEEVLELMDTISIDIDGELMGKYESWSISDDNYFVAYHHMLHKIDVFSLSNRKFSYSIRLDKQGPHEVVPLGNVLKIQNEYFASSGSFFYRISSYGLVLDKKMFSDLSISKEGYLSGQKGAQMVGYNYFSSDHEHHGFFQPIYKFRGDGSFDFSAYFMSSIDFITWESRYIPVNYPASFLESHSKSIFLGDANMIRSGASFVFNFPGSNEIFEFDTHTMNLTTHSPEILNKEEMKIDVIEYGSDMFSQVDAQMFSPRYLPVKYDKKNNGYYRLHKNKVHGRFENGANMFDASFFLIKMDSNFNTLVQYDLGSMFQPRFEIHDGYLYFSPREVDKSGLYTLKIYRMKP